MRQIILVHLCGNCIPLFYRKLRTSANGRILINMSCSLIGLYVVFVMGGQVTVIPDLCGISSALLHYFLLVFFAWTTVEAVWLYLKLVKIFGLQTIESKFFMTASLLCWCKQRECYDLVHC